MVGHDANHRVHGSNKRAGHTRHQPLHCEDVPRGKRPSSDPLAQPSPAHSFESRPSAGKSVCLSLGPTDVEHYVELLGNVTVLASHEVSASTCWAISTSSSGSIRSDTPKLLYDPRSPAVLIVTSLEIPQLDRGKPTRRLSQPWSEVRTLWNCLF